MTGKPRLIAETGGVKIVDTRQRIRIVSPAHLPQSICNQLIVAGWMATNDGAWERSHGERAVMSALSIIGQLKGTQE